MSKIDYTKPILERDYSELIGTEVTVNHTDLPIKYDCFVAGIHPEKGISIVSIDDPNYEHICLNKKIHSSRNYKGIYAHMIRQIKRQEFISPVLICAVADKGMNSAKGRLFNLPLTCAFK